MQIPPSWAGREEAIISVWSLCHTTRELSMGVPSGGPSSLPSAVKVTCHMPVIRTSEELAEMGKRLPDCPSHRCGNRDAPGFDLALSPQPAKALPLRNVPAKMIPTARANFLSVGFM